ncbi:complement receptor type 1-like [Xiphias gladius]|uniref:complement receptor type 1-like n=1 Tax=Xiphias gladius TaxID=8245 RepID=UPI001A9931FC|nr:complement receptor type 1-like [Xiphias gladius]
MKSVAWHILALCFALPASAQVPKRCSAPLEYPHTRLDKKFTSRQKFGSGEKVYYDCAEDFTPSRGSRAVQCVEGKWTKVTLKCEKRSCGNAGDLPNGQFQYEGNSFLGEKVYAVCNEGYTLKGLNYMICKKSGWTGEFPVCDEGETTCSSPAVANSVKGSGDVSVYRVGDNVTFACSHGFQLAGAPQVTCGPSGLWQPQPPQCLPSPDGKTEQSSIKETGGCGVPPIISNSNANLADKYITLTSFASGDRVHYTCDVGYIQAGGSRYRTCKDGKWTPLFLKCEPKVCGSAGEILNGQFTYTGVEFGDTATAICDEGYSPVGKVTRNCMSNGWDGRVPVCEAVVCEDPPEVTNAEMKDPQEPPYTYRSVVHYHCRVGTLIGQREIWCTEHGTWSAPPPRCTVMTCPSPNVPSAYWMGPHNNLYQYRDTISIACNPGYARIGPSTVTCGGDGRWSPGLPICRRTSRHRHWRSKYAS